MWRMGSNRIGLVTRLEDKSTHKIGSAGAATRFSWCGNDFLKTNLENKDSSESTRRTSDCQSSQGTQSSPINNKSTQEIDAYPGGSVGNQVYFGSSKSNMAMKVTLGMENGEYVLKLNTGMTDKAQTEAMLSSQAAMLRRLGETLIFLSKVFKSLG